MPGEPELRTGPGILAAVTPDDHDYLAREARARVEIDRQLVQAGWLVQQADAANIGAGPGVAVREFILEKGHGRVDYLLFVDGQPAGVIEAKPEGTTLTEVEHQSGKYVDGLPDWMVGSPGASQLPAPTDPGVTVSRHRALLTSRQYARTHFQWANRPGSRSCSPVHHRLNRL